MRVAISPRRYDAASMLGSFRPSIGCPLALSPPCAGAGTCCRMRILCGEAFRLFPSSPHAARRLPSSGPHRILCAALSAGCARIAANVEGIARCGESASPATVPLTPLILPVEWGGRQDRPSGPVGDAAPVFQLQSVFAICPFAFPASPLDPCGDVPAAGRCAAHKNGPASSAPCLEACWPRGCSCCLRPRRPWLRHLCLQEVLQLPRHRAVWGVAFILRSRRV